MPELYRIHRLDIVMSVYKDGRKRRIHSLLSENDRMSLCRINGSLIGTGFHKKLHKSFSATLHVRLMLLEGAH